MSVKRLMHICSPRSLWQAGASQFGSLAIGAIGVANEEIWFSFAKNRVDDGKFLPHFFH